MSEFKVKIPKSLEGERKAVEMKVGGVISSEEKRRLLSDFIDSAMKGAKQLGDKELVELGRAVKKGKCEAVRSAQAR